MLPDFCADAALAALAVFAVLDIRHAYSRGERITHPTMPRSRPDGDAAAAGKRLRPAIIWSHITVYSIGCRGMAADLPDIRQILLPRLEPSRKELLMFD